MTSVTAGSPTDAGWSWAPGGPDDSVFSGPATGGRGRFGGDRQADKFGGLPRRRGSSPRPNAGLVHRKTWPGESNTPASRPCSSGSCRGVDAAAGTAGDSSLAGRLADSTEYVNRERRQHIPAGPECRGRFLVPGGRPCRLLPTTVTIRFRETLELFGIPNCNLSHIPVCDIWISHYGNRPLRGTGGRLRAQ